MAYCTRDAKEAHEPGQVLATAVLFDYSRSLILAVSFNVAIYVASALDRSN